MIAVIHSVWISPTHATVGDRLAQIARGRWMRQLTSVDRRVCLGPAAEIVADPVSDVS
jgi:hypothetical protein